MQAFQKTQLQPPVGPSVDSPCQRCNTRTHPSYRVLSLKLPPPPCAVLTVSSAICLHQISGKSWKICVLHVRKMSNMPQPATTGKDHGSICDMSTRDVGLHGTIKLRKAKPTFPSGPTSRKTPWEAFFFLWFP